MSYKSTQKQILLILITGAALLFSNVLHADSYLYRKAITIDRTKVSSTLSNFPIFVSIANDNDLKNHVTNPSGYDLVFKDFSGGQLDHELEKWDGATGTVAAWVRIPSLSSTTDTVIYMWYGDNAATISRENKPGVWDSGFKGVWHLPDGTNLTTGDSTSNALNGANNGATATAGMMDGAGNFNGTGNSLSVAHNASLQPQNITLEMWIKPAATLTSGVIAPFLRKDANNVNAMGQGYNFNYYSSSGMSFWVGNGSNSWVGPSYAATLAAGTWYHVAATYDGAALKMYLNGSQIANQSWTGGISYGTYTNPFYAGFMSGGGIGSKYFNGTIDEVRLSGVARSADWILVGYRNQSAPQAFYTISSEGSPENHAPSAQSQAVIVNVVDENTTKGITLAATDEDNDPLSYQVVTQPAHGTLNGTLPSVTYTPENNYFGSDSFTFKANDGLVDSNVATVSITVQSSPYLYRKAITIDHTKIPATLSNFPILVSIANDNDLKNHVTNPSGYDLVFKDFSGSQLDHELEKWDGAAGTVAAWVRIPSLSSTADNVIYLWYGNSGVTSSRENKTGVWDSGYKGVWHFPDGTTLSPNDSTFNAFNGANSGATATTGVADGAGNFNGTGNYVSVAHHASLKPQAITLEMWIKPAATLTSGVIAPFLRKDANDVNGIGRGYNFNYYSGSGMSFWIGNGSNGWVGPSYAATLSAGNWYHVAATYDGAAFKMYLNGAQVANQPWSGGIGYGSDTNPLYAGFMSGNSIGSKYFNGTIDEVRLSGVARSADWMLAAYRNQSAPQAFYTIGNEGRGLAVTAFAIPSLSNIRTVSITSFAATVGYGVSGYLVNESASTPSSIDPNWSPTPQTQYVFSSDGYKNLYAWARDGQGNISDGFNASVIVDTVAPTVTAFSLPVKHNSLTVPITTFTATDALGVTGYLLTETSSTPSLYDPQWTGTTPTTYTFPSQGSKVLYAWTIDAVGNISNPSSAAVFLYDSSKITYIYDELNRLIQVVYTDGSRLTYTYDALGNRQTLSRD